MRVIKKITIGFLLVGISTTVNAQWLNPSYTGYTNTSPHYGLANPQVNYLDEDYISCYFKDPTGNPSHFVFGGARIDATPVNQGMIYLLSKDINGVEERIGAMEFDPTHNYHDKVEIKEMLVEGNYLYVLLGLWQNGTSYPDEFYSYGVLRVDLTAPAPMLSNTANYEEIYPTYDGCSRLTNLSFRKAPGGPILVGYNLEDPTSYSSCQDKGLKVDRIDPGLNSVSNITLTYSSPSNNLDFKSLEYNQTTGHFFIISTDVQTSPTSNNLVIMEMDLNSGIPVSIVNTQILYFPNNPALSIDNVHTTINDNVVYSGIERGNNSYYIIASDFTNGTFEAREVRMSDCEYEPTSIRMDVSTNSIQIAGMSRNCFDPSKSDQPVIHRIPTFPNWPGLVTVSGQYLSGTSQASGGTPSFQSSDFYFSDFVINQGNQERYLFGYFEAGPSAPNQFAANSLNLKIFNFDNPECLVSIEGIDASDFINRDLDIKPFYLIDNQDVDIQVWEDGVLVYNPILAYEYGCNGLGGTFKKDPTTSNNLINEVDKRDQYEVKIYDLMGRNVLNFTTAELSSKKDIKVKVKRKVRNELSSSQVLIIKAKGKTTNESITYKEVFIQ